MTMTVVCPVCLTTRDVDRTYANPGELKSDILDALTDLAAFRAQLERTRPALESLIEASQELTLGPLPEWAEELASRIQGEVGTLAVLYSDEAR